MQRDSKLLLLTAGALTPLLFVGGPGPFASRSLQATWNLGHAVLFFCLIDGLLRLRLDAVVRARKRWGATSAVATLAIAVAIEWLQGFVGREQSLQDVWIGLGGATLGFLDVPVWPSSRRAISFRILTAVATGLFLACPLALALMDESRARSSFPVLSDFASPLELDRWAGPAKLSFESERHGEHDGAMVVGMARERSAFHLAYFPHDWSRYRSLVLRIRNDGPRRELICRLNDLAHDLAVPHDPADHYEAHLPLKPGWQDLSIDLDVAARSIANRRMDVSTMNGLTCLLPRVDEETQFIVDRVWLER